MSTDVNTEDILGFSAGSEENLISQVKGTGVCAPPFPNNKPEFVASAYDHFSLWAEKNG